MLNSKVSQAVTAALALGAAAAAQAAAPAAVTIGTVPAGNILYISGSTAITPALVDYMVNATKPLCNKAAGTPVVYTGTETGGQFNAVSCIAASSLGLPANTKIAIIKENNAGSKNGILPLSAPATNPVSYPQTTAAGFDGHCVPAAAPITQAGFLPYFPVTCDATYPIVTSTATTGPYSALGYADVEAAIFGLNPTNVGSGSSVDTPFGIVLSLGAYHALQGAEGLTENNTLANMPTLSRVQLAGMFNGFVTDWTHVFGTGSGSSVGAQSVHFGNSGLNGANHVCYDGTQNSTAADCQAGTQASVAVAPHDTTIYFCERGQSSGTQQTTQIFFAGEGCIGSPIKFLAPTTVSCLASGCTWSAASFGTNEVFAGNGQGDDLACLEGHDEQGQFAVSLSSTDQAWGAVAVANNLQAKADWRFIRIDGAAPSNENIAAGKYDLWAQSAFYYATSGANLPTGNELTLQKFFTAAATQIGPDTTAAIDLGLQRSNPSLDGGLLAIPIGSATPPSPTETQTQFRATPVNSFLRNNPGNNCQPPYPAGGVSVTNTPTWDPVSIQ
jgi:ABC-type phosphate transport system substrate-binding protein